jgi:hypothetical protein
MFVTTSVGDYVNNSKCLEFYYMYTRPNHNAFDKFEHLSVRCVKDYNDSYTKPARIIYYTKNNSNQITRLGIETNPDPNKVVLDRGVLYGSQSQDLHFNSDLTLPDGVNYENQAPDSDKIMELQWNSEYPSLGTKFRPVLIYKDGTVSYPSYGLEWIYSNN